MMFVIFDFTGLKKKKKNTCQDSSTADQMLQLFRMRLLTCPLPQQTLHSQDYVITTMNNKQAPTEETFPE